jgi:hypothetical protein
LSVIYIQKGTCIEAMVNIDIRLLGNSAIVVRFEENGFVRVKCCPNFICAEQQLVRESSSAFTLLDQDNHTLQVIHCSDSRGYQLCTWLLGSFSCFLGGSFKQEKEVE